MASRLTLTALGAALALGLISPATAATNLINNGGFEDQIGFTGIGNEVSNHPTDWTTNATFEADEVNEVGSAIIGVPHSGNYSVVFGASNNGTPTTLSQTFADVVGGLYTVSFDAYNGQYAGEPGSRPLNFLTASAGGQSTTLADNVRGGFVSASCADCWVQGTFIFTGTGSDTLSLSAITDFNFWHLDDVSVTLLSTPGAIPEPATWAMMILGFGGVGVTLRSRRQRAVLVA